MSSVTASMPVISIAGKDASALDVAVEVSDGNAVQEPPKARGSRMKRLTRSIQLGDMPTVGRRRNSLTPSSGLTVVTEASPKSGDRATKRRSSTGSVGSNHSDEASATGSEHVSRTPLYQLLGYKSMDDAPPALRRFAGLDAALEKLSASAAETNSPTGTRSTADSAGLTYLDLQSFKEEGSSWSAAFDRVLGRVAGTMRRPRSRKGSKTAYTPDTSGASGSGPTPEERAALARKLLPRLHAAFHNQHDIGGFTGAQAAVRFGRSRVDETGTDWSAGLDPLPAIDLCIGTVRGNERMTRDHIVNWMSTTKPLAAIAIAQLEERGLCDVELPVATYLPKFGQMGKGGVLIKHLLTHTAGVPYADIECWATLHKWDLIVRTICEAPLADDWVPGRRCGYHTYSAWFILGEIVKVLSGLPYEQYVQQHIFAPLGLRDCHVGMSDATFHAYEKQGRLCELRTYAKRKDNKLVENARCPNGITLNEATACVPGANGRGPANEWVAVYEMLLNGGVGWNGVVLLQPATVAKYTKRARVGMFDEVAQDPTDWTLGCFIGTKVLGKHADPNTFGHGGSQSSIGFCDPELNFTAVLCCNGRPGPERHRARLQALCSAVYEDVLALKSSRSKEQAKEAVMRRVAEQQASPSLQASRGSPVLD